MNRHSFAVMPPVASPSWETKVSIRVEAGNGFRVVDALDLLGKDASTSTRPAR